jgi:uncharacterized protein (DUF1697 family)
MASVVFLRAVNVGGHKRFRPAALVEALAALKITSIGAAGTFVVHAPLGASEIQSRFRKALPFDATLMVCSARDVAALSKALTDGSSRPGAAEKVFVSVLENRPRRIPPLPHGAPSEKEWQVRLLALHGRFVVSLHRRVGRTLIYPNEVVEKLFGVAATTRGWPTILRVQEALASRPGRGAPD